MTKGDLQEYVKQVREQKRLESRIAELTAEMQRIKSVVLSDTPKGKGKSNERLEQIIDEKQQLINDYKAQIKKSHIIMSKIEVAVNSVSDERFRTILSMRYLDGRTWEYIADKMNYELRWIYILHGRALNKIRDVK